jgi:gentisate 1,2-dioxygenase
MIYVGVEGQGTIIADGMALSIGPRDVVVAPAWSSRLIEAETDLVLFSYSDRATQQSLGLWREQR